MSQVVGVKMKDTDSAFPLTDGSHVALGMTLAQYAAIRLKVPRSGDPDIDEMIRESRRADFAGLVLAGLTTLGVAARQHQREKDAKTACDLADALIAELEKGAGK
jgi:hypothetical protein